MTEGHNTRTQRFEYTLVSYGEETPLIEREFRTLEGAIEEYAAKGWRFVESNHMVAVFERPVE